MWRLNPSWYDIYQFIFLCCGRKYQYKKQAIAEPTIGVMVCDCEKHHIILKAIRTDGSGYISLSPQFTESRLLGTSYGEKKPIY
ncbi:hypothetical protein [Diatraea saccharalis granulovirus]|uniref:Uncharacterized protein n=1 Tax=Diatraea saccharalis granulovirus TaxID=1675862 RepID=A0A0R7EZ07_9BBAC|nr:hypothetical protein [Diatraea saccharalis granulovirus]AKN80816.1 hypothetical protein [Diatraea saccharalis granulovirus]